MKPMTNALAPVPGVLPPKMAQTPKPPGNPAPMQRDGNQNVMPNKASGAGLQTRSASPAAFASSGIERSMGAMADQIHKVGKGRRGV